MMTFRDGRMGLALDWKVLYDSDTKHSRFFGVRSSVGEGFAPDQDIDSFGQPSGSICISTAKVCNELCTSVLTVPTISPPNARKVGCMDDIGGSFHFSIIASLFNSSCDWIRSGTHIETDAVSRVLAAFRNYTAVNCAGSEFF